MKIRAAVNSAMADVSQASSSAENAARWATAIMSAVWEHGITVEVDLMTPEREEALSNIPVVGPLVSRVVSCFDDLEVRIKLGKS